jgi:hypothetical protein
VAEEAAADAEVAAAVCAATAASLAAAEAVAGPDTESASLAGEGRRLELPSPSVRGYRPFALGPPTAVPPVQLRNSVSRAVHAVIRVLICWASWALEVPI